MNADFVSLDDFKFARPCLARWELMQKVDLNNRVRFCQCCGKNVYNVSFMSRAEVEALLQRHEEVPCLSLARRADGTIITGDCPVSQRLTYKKWRKSALFAVLVTLIPSPISVALIQASSWALKTVPALSFMGEKMDGVSHTMQIYSEDFMRAIGLARARENGGPR